MRQEDPVMAMRTVALKELSPDVRSFLAQVRNGEGIVVQDDQGCARFGVIPYIEATPAAKKKAWKEIQRIQRKVGKRMAREGWRRGPIGTHQSLGLLRLKKS